jgi:hypothetical protein
MSPPKSAIVRHSSVAIVACTIGLITAVASLDARVTRIVIDKTTTPVGDLSSDGPAGPYESVAGRAYGELDPNDPHNAVITDIRLAPRNAHGKVEYMATFLLVKPTDMTKSSRILWEFAPNRGRGDRIRLTDLERSMGDIGLTSGWQGDNTGTTAQTVPNTNHYAVVPIAKGVDGAPITGEVLGRIVNASGAESQAIFVIDNGLPYRPATLDTAKARIITHTAERIDGVVEGAHTMANQDWAWARCDATNPFPGTPDPTQVCLKSGFDPALAYNVIFPARDPYVLGIGFAAFRDLGSFFKNERSDDSGTPNPLATHVSWVIGRGHSQSGNFLKAFLHQGFNQDEAGRQVQDGTWAMIAGGQLPLNLRFALPDGAPRLYSPDREAPQWWSPYPDPLRKRASNGILDRCAANRTCPKIVEVFGATEMWFLKMPAALTGTSADGDIPLSGNVRRYYIGSSPHGGGPGGFSVTPLAVPSASGRWGRCVLPANPMPFAQTTSALVVAFREWVMRDAPMPPSRYPTLREGTLVAATKDAMGFPTIPGLPPTAPTGLINPGFESEFGPDFNPADQTGIVTVQPPSIRQVFKMTVPKVDADGNELGGVPVVLREAPLGTYLGWNITSAGFFKGQICAENGGMIPFARTRAERQATGDVRLSLQERYGDHEGYVNAVRKGAEKAVSEGFLLERDAMALVALAAASNVLN